MLSLQVGQQYEKENEEDFKDKQDFKVWDRNSSIEGLWTIAVGPCSQSFLLVALRQLQ